MIVTLVYSSREVQNHKTYFMIYVLWSYTGSLSQNWSNSESLSSLIKPSITKPPPVPLPHSFPQPPLLWHQPPVSIIQAQAPDPGVTRLSPQQCPPSETLSNTSVTASICLVQTQLCRTAFNVWWMFCGS